jgi:putative tricarboxylic transport membrane protein
MPRPPLGPLALAALAGGALFIAWDYGLWSFGAPGAGLMPSVAAAVLAVTSLLTLREKPPAEEEVDPDPRRLAFYTAALVVLLPAILAVGMLPALALFIVFCLKLAERMSWRSTLAIAIGATAGSWLLFERLLQVQLPRGVLG